jgi:aryl-alcohol dehydrogenase-like predicted oxidoreductase
MSTVMNRRPIHNTDLFVSVLCLGTMTFGYPVRRAEAVRLVHWALDHGINFLDTADIYEGYDRVLGSPGGVAEEILGEALQGRRSRVIVTTKVGNPVGDRAYQGTGLGRGHILHQIDASLRRLRTDHVDLYLLHRPDASTPLAETLAVMAGLIETGKVRHWGFSNFDAAQIREMIQLCDENHWPRPVVSQPPYSWLRRDIEADHMPLCRQLGIAVTPYRPLQGGLLTGKYRQGQPLPSDSRASDSPSWLAVSEDLYPRLERFESEARAAGITPGRYAIRWLLDQPGIASVIAGVKRREQLDDLLAGCG